MLRPKEALLKAGRIKEIGRGRLSLDNDKWCKEQAELFARTNGKEGYNILGYSVADVKGETTVTKSAPTGEKVIADGFISYPENEYRAYETQSKRARSMREGCGNCKLSLTGHMCEHPRVVAVDGRLGHVAVTIERR